jgi:lipopolysaccharide transport system permease protein
MLKHIIEIYRSKSLINELIKKELKNQSKQRILGITWAILPTLLSTLGFVFMNKAGLLNIGSFETPYYIYVYIGMAVWTIFISVTFAISNSLVNNTDILTKTPINHFTIMLGSLGTILVMFNINIIIILIFSIGLLKISIFNIVLALASFIPILFLSVYLGSIISYVNLISRDISAFLQSLLSVILFAFPIIYVESNVKSPFLIKIMELNPLKELIILPRNLLVGIDDFNLNKYLIGLFFSFLIFMLSLRLMEAGKEMIAERA